MALMIFLYLATVILAREDDVISLFIPDADPQPMVASIIAQNSATTSYSLNCPPGTDRADCGLGPGLFLTTAPTSVEYLIQDQGGDIYNHVVCLVTGTTHAVCTATVTGTGANFPGTDTRTLNQDQMSTLPVTITAGTINNSTAATTSTSTDPEPTSSSSGESPVETGASSSAHAATPTSKSGDAVQIRTSPKLLLAGLVSLMVGLLQV